MLEPLVWAGIGVLALSKAVDVLEGSARAGLQRPRPGAEHSEVDTWELYWKTVDKGGPASGMTRGLPFGTTRGLPSFGTHPGRQPALERVGAVVLVLAVLAVAALRRPRATLAVLVVRAGAGGKALSSGPLLRHASGTAANWRPALATKSIPKHSKSLLKKVISTLKHFSIDAG